MDNVTHDHAIRILGAHGFEPDQPQSWYPCCQEYDADSTFYIEVGRKDFYTMSELRDWLGY